MDNYSEKGVYICSIKNENNDYETEELAPYTVNTWQKNRGEEEIKRDTLQGKTAENVVSQILNNKKSIRYIPYDLFRNDSFQKHAPFDGILFKNPFERDCLVRIINVILLDVAKSDIGSITPETRAFLKRNNVYTVEVKSTAVNRKKKEEVRQRLKNLNLSVDNKKKYYHSTLIEVIKKNDDFLTYPHFCRSGSFNSFHSYAKYYFNKYRDRIKNTCESNVDEDIINIEMQNLSDFHIRVYVNYEQDYAYIIGYIKKEDFFRSPIIMKKMYKKGKSEEALYLTKPLTNAVSIDNLEFDL